MVDYRQAARSAIEGDWLGAFARGDYNNDDLQTTRSTRRETC